MMDGKVNCKIPVILSSPRNISCFGYIIRRFHIEVIADKKADGNFTFVSNLIVVKSLIALLHSLVL